MIFYPCTFYLQALTRRDWYDRERTRKPRLVGGIRGAEYIIRLRLMNLRFPYREAPPYGRVASLHSDFILQRLYHNAIYRYGALQCPTV
jgi:hypothetical protein